MKLGKVDIDAAFAAGTPIDQAMNEAVKAAVAQHRQTGRPLAVWRDGQVQLVPAEEAADHKGKTEVNEK